ncbi:hypothetical protein SeLEV6574_g00415 [Synchytrium endobioticum]|uniref:Rab-GAP TBC domain-containing protein n=1 Tax=Synchytrium endobioticum TaxID=286115 RepID=A0A507DJU0_9FUNG|nr:hypothetical protein SeLEV6574_g00415 [Synchytrium endobioticum]
MKTAVPGETNTTSIRTESGHKKWTIHTKTLPGTINLKLSSSAHSNVGLRSGIVGFGQIQIVPSKSTSPSTRSLTADVSPKPAAKVEVFSVTTVIEDSASTQPQKRPPETQQSEETIELASQVASSSALSHKGESVGRARPTITPTLSNLPPSADISSAATSPVTAIGGPTAFDGNISNLNTSTSSDTLKRSSGINSGDHNSLRKSTDGRGHAQPNGKEKGSDKLESSMMAEAAKLNSLAIRFQKFRAVLDTPNVDLDQLRKLSWKGVPDEIRPMVWQLLMGYLPCNMDRRETTLARKRSEYAEYVDQSFARGKEGLDQALHHQIHIDIQRTNSHLSLYQDKRIQEALERILYCWAIRHPASGYVQGINDLVTPFFQVFLSGELSTTTADIETYDVLQIPVEKLSQVEADSFWCLTKLLDGIQDNYTFAQPGIQRQIGKLKELISRIDSPLATHLQAQGVEFIQFAFRWMNCLLMRELSIKNTIRMWDTYQAEGPDGFSDFHLYVCASFLVKWSEQLRKMEFQDIMMFLQSLPTQSWEDKEIELLLSEAFMWKSLFHNAPSHLQNISMPSPQQ